MIWCLAAGQWGEATHTNYDTDEPCFCDAPFDFLPGPCMDAPEPITGDSPENGSG